MGLGNRKLHLFSLRYNWLGKSAGALVHLRGSLSRYLADITRVYGKRRKKERRLDVRSGELTPVDPSSLPFWASRFGNIRVHFWAQGRFTVVVDIVKSSGE